MAKHRIAVIPGDGIGPEVIEAALMVMGSVGVDVEPVFCEAGYGCWRRLGNQLPNETMETIKELRICLKGPTMTPSGPETYRSVAVTLRQMFNLYANVRPIQSRVGVPSLHSNVSLIIVRENTEGLYKGLEYRVNGDTALGIRVITREGSERIARFAFELAERKGRKRVTLVHKANILKETCGLFRDVCLKVATNYPGISVDELYVDAAALKIVSNPQELDVLLTTNMFGDILSDEAAGMVGGLGMIPSANIGESYALFEPIHGTAPDIAGKGVANPTAMILSLALMLEHLGEIEAATKIEQTINRVFAEGKRLTPDLKGSARTLDMAKEVLKELEW